MQNRIVFTLCSNNYLSYAKTLGDSLKETNPDIIFIIGLTDKLNPEVDYTFFEPYQLLVYDQIGVAFFDEMIAKYNIIEFNTSVKPFYFEYLFNLFGKDSLVYYLDPDIFCYSTFLELHNLLETNNILLTPHILKPHNTVSAFEQIILNVGIYNLGFIGMKYSDATQDFLTWWQIRVKDFCYILFSKGLFTDQIWINFVPILFPGVFVIPSLAYNVACWNIYERSILVVGNKYFVNDTSTPLVFFHFSGIDLNNMIHMSRIKTAEYEIDSRHDLKPLFINYAAQVRLNRFDSLSQVRPLLNFKEKTKSKFSFRQRIGNSLKYRLKLYLYPLFKVKARS